MCLEAGNIKMIGRLKIALMLSYICIASASAAIITPALPAIEAAFKLSHGALEWVVSIFLLGYVIGQLPYGIIANRFGRVRALRSGLILNCLGIIVCIAAANLLNYPLLLAGRMLTALGAASGLSCTFMLINETLTSDQAKRAMSFAIVSFTLGIGLSVAVGGIVTQNLSWKYCFAVLLLHGFLMLYLTKFLDETLKKPIKLKVTKTLCNLVKIARNKRLVVFSLLVGFVSAFAYCYSAAAPIFSKNSLHLLPDQYGYWNLVNMIGMLGSGFLGAYLMKRVGPRNLLIIGIVCLLSVFTFFILIAALNIKSSVLFFMTSAGFYLFSGMLFPAGSYFALNMISDKANASSAMSFINMGSAMIGVIILGYMPFSSITSFIVVLMAFFVISVLLVTPYLLKENVSTQ